MFENKLQLFKRGIMAWILLTIAGLLEVVWAYFMKQSNGFTLVTPTIVTIITMIISFGLLSISMKSLPMGTSYMVWTGIGAVGAFIVGIVILGEDVSALRIIAALLILGGIGLMKVSTPS